MVKIERSIEEAGQHAQKVLRLLETALVGQRELLRGLLVGVIADGHVLIEGVPGLGKTRAVNLLARASQLTFKRLQFTPDLLPADILGSRIYNQRAAEFETVTGPIFANFILADEINRAPAKVQSALLETMQERQVTIGKESRKLQPPFLVFATQNPIEQEGTYPLPEAQLDRFLLKLVVGYPRPKDEHKIVRMVIDETQTPSLEPVISGDEIVELQQLARQVFVEKRLIHYAIRLVAASRDPRAAGLDLERYIEVGASPRASIGLIQAARAVALLEGRDAVLPDDIKAMAPAVLRHRIIATYYAEAETVTTDRMVGEILAAVPTP